MNGIDKSYTTWYCHGEPFEDDDAIVEPHVTSSNHITEDVPRMLDLVDDAFMGVQSDDIAPSTNVVSSDDVNGQEHQMLTTHELGRIRLTHTKNLSTKS
ncbi:hypothetical protein GIB67_016190 [Kingdonia uniflora]|uniref:Uncharacterized protein n=1 Tax=Kingdonia uniflora TaxID=39325 RepID=A0A7J7LSU2_9MAGN|nr:hypothetical protein GIB67_016190 [Kingdonia uniflora]